VGVVGRCGAGGGGAAARSGWHWQHAWQMRAVLVTYYLYCRVTFAVAHKRYVVCVCVWLPLLEETASLIHGFAGGICHN
jgi:hypothetical protein